jgi:hypothetical protein
MVNACNFDVKKKLNIKGYCVRKLLFITMLFSSVGFAEEIPSRFQFAAGVSAAYKLIPVPTMRTSLKLNDSLLLDGSLGTLLVAGDLSLGSRYTFEAGEFGQFSVGLKSGLTYSITDSALYYAFGIGYQLKSFSLEVGPICYYRRDVEKSTSHNKEIGGLVGLLYQFKS